MESLISFLKSVLRLPEDDYNEIEIADTHLLREFDGDKLAIFDVKLKTKSRKIVHIEIQLKVTPELKNRIILYDSKLIAEQIGSGDDYDIIEIYTLELVKLPESTDGTALYDWAKFIAADTEEELSMVAERNPQVAQAVVRLRELSADERARDLYERREKARRDQSSRERWAHQQGEKEKSLSIARNLVKMNLPIEQILTATGLNKEEVESMIALTD